MMTDLEMAKLIAEKNGFVLVPKEPEICPVCDYRTKINGRRAADALSAAPEAEATDGRMLMAHGDVRAEFVADQAKKDAVFAKLVTFFNDHHCWSGESYCQCDGPQIGSMDLMCDLLDLIDAKVTYE
jgi:hypothetical protein